MKAIKIIDGDLYCGIENAIIYENNTFIELRGNYKNSFELGKVKPITQIIESHYYSLDTTIEEINDKYKIIAGETSYGGRGFVAVLYKESKKYKWILSWDSMNNPISITLNEGIINLKTDLNFPNEVCFIIPIEEPEKFKIEETTNHRTTYPTQ